MQFSELSNSEQRTFKQDVIREFCLGAFRLGWLLKNIDKDGIATFELLGREDYACEVNLANLLADIIFCDRDQPEQGETKLNPAHIFSVLNTRLAILAALKQEGEEGIMQALRQIGKRFKGRLRYWKIEEDRDVEEVIKEEAPELWFENGEEVQ